MTRKESGKLPAVDDAAIQARRLAEIDAKLAALEEDEEVVPMREKDIDRRNSGSDEGPETSEVMSEVLDDFSVADDGSESESFLAESQARREDQSHDFSVSENEVSGSHVLDQYDYKTNAMPPMRRSGW